MDASTRSVQTALQSQYITHLNVDQLKEYKSNISKREDKEIRWKRLTHTIKSISDGNFSVVNDKGLCIRIKYPEDGIRDLPLTEIDRITDKYTIKIQNVIIGIYWFM